MMRTIQRNLFLLTGTLVISFVLSGISGLSGPLLTDADRANGYDERALPDPIRVSVDISKTSTPINPLLYGHFIENLSNWFEGGVWAEMLGDRKFFYPVNNAELDPPNSRSRFMGRWYPVGPEQYVAADKGHPYVGKHSPRVTLHASEARGIQQGGLAVVADKEYSGRIVLAGSTGARVTVSLVWGDGLNDKATTQFRGLTPAYQTHAFNFTAAANSDDARLEITGTGSESFWIGAVSLMPADNIEGFRPDIIELFRSFNPTMLRWGGNFSAGYEWRDGIGDRDKRPPRYDFAWNAVEPNDMGTFEVLALNRLVGAEPNIGVNAGLGDAYSAGLWVEYVNGSVDTPMGALRAKHGHAEPFNVKWWGIGNEMYGQWQLGHMRIEHYVMQHNHFAERMLEADPNITLVASGASPFEMSTVARHFRQPLYSKLPFEFGSPEDWSGKLLEGAGENIDYLAEHFYHVPGSRFDVELQQFVETDDPLIDQMRRAPNRVRAAVEAWEVYNRTFPWLKDSGIKIVLDEWPARGTDAPRAVVTAETMNELFRYTDIFVMSAYTCGPCAIRYDKTDAVLNGSGLLFKLYTEHFGTIPVAVDGDIPQREVSGTVGVDKPAMTSGSPTYPLDVVAALSDDRSVLTIAVANPTETMQDIDLELQGMNLPTGGRKWVLTGPVDGNNIPGEEPVVTITESGVSNATSGLSVDPMSVTIFEFQAR